MKKISAVVTAAMFTCAASAFAANTLTVIDNPNTTGNATTKALSVNHDGTTNNVYVESTHPNNETHFRTVFWVNPYTLNLDAHTSVRLGQWGSDGNGFHVILFLKRNDVDSSWRVNTWYKQDTTGYQPGPGVFLTTLANANQWRQVQVEFTASTAPGANDGSVTVQRLLPSPSAVFSATNLDTDLLDVDNARYGSLAGQGANANSGAYLFDEYESYR